MIRVPVLDKNGKPLMPTKSSRARRWLKEGKAKIVCNDLNIFCIGHISTLGHQYYIKSNG